MGGGERFETFEDNLLKMWVLLNHKTFGAEEQEEEVLNQIRQNFESDGWRMHLSFNANKEKINLAISKLNEKIKEDIFELVSNYKVEVEENGGGYTLHGNGERMTYPTLKKNN